MEIIAEIVFQLVWGLFEFLLTGVGEGLFNWGRNSLEKKRARAGREPTMAGPVLTAFGYTAFGALCGLLSVWIAPAHFIQSPALRALNLVGSSLLAGLLLAQWRRIRAEPEADTNFPQDFINGGLLAFALAATRFALTR